MNLRNALPALLATVSVVSGQTNSPLSPEQALASFQCEPGLRIELVAAEPTVADPVAMAFDEAGRLFVVENRGYPTGPGPGKPPAGIIARLEDTNGDGRYDKRTVFADGLTFPNGIMPWRGGLLVTCAPDIIYLKDTDGDGRADVREIVLTGFDASNTTQLRVSHPTLGADNWIYVTSGLTGGKVHRPESSSSVEIKTDLRFRPDTWEFEAADGRAQFGMSFDDFGHRFICMNRVHVQHVVLPSRYLRRNPALNFRETVQNVPEEMVSEPLAGHGSAARIYPLSHNITTADSHAGTFTAACGVMIYRGTALPHDYYGNVFACDPTGNLVHRDRLSAVGATFSATRALEKQELIASTDDWFRPVYLTLGPDGALYVCDMYRKTIEHPAYLPDEVRKHTDFDSGKDKGRIYRLVAVSNSAPAQKIDFRAASIAELCAQLNHPNGWQRDTAHRLLLEKADPSMAGPLRRLFDGATDSSPAARVLALHLLERISALAEPTLLSALDDFHPGVRENALMLAEPRLPSSAALAERIEDLADDPDGRVRFQVALALGEIHEEFPAAALAKVSTQEPPDKWTRAGILSSISGHETKFARSYADSLPRSPSAGSTPPGVVALMQELGQLLGATRGTNDLAQVIDDLLGKSQPTLATPWQVAGLSGFLTGAEQRGAAINLPKLTQPQNSSSDSAFARRLRAVQQKARALCTDKSASVELRQTAIDLVARLDLPASKVLLMQLLNAQQPVGIQTAAVRALTRGKGEANAAELLKAQRWHSYTPPVRESLLDSILRNPECLPALFAAIESGEIPAGVVNSARRKQLLQTKNESIRRRAEAVFKNSGSEDRMKVYDQYKTIISLSPSPANGREVFRKQCSICHRLDRDGVPVGPDLFGIRNQSKETILLHIIVPEYEIMPGFVNYLVEAKDGRSLSGIISAESPQSITLRRALNEEDTILRTNIVSITSSGLSLMPQELEKNMSRQEMADLLAYLKGEQ